MNLLNQIDVLDIVAIAKKAGRVIMEIYSQDFEVNYKSDNSPLTLADIEANKVIHQELTSLSVKFPILSEEGIETSFEERKGWDFFWLVDPLDGTKEFMKKNGEFTVNIALICKDNPILGVVYAPALNICYWAAKGQGAFKDGARLLARKTSQKKSYKIMSSRSHQCQETKEFIEKINTNKVKKVIQMGSSLKICMLAEGVADIYPRLGPTMEWDTAAAHAIVNESGMKLESYKNGSYSIFLYNKENLVNSAFVVS